MGTPADTRRRPDERTLLGRRSEIAVVDRWVDQAEAGAPRIGIVSGAPGVGKTHLLRTVAARARARGLRTLRGTGSPDAPPLLPLLTCLEPLIEEARQGGRPDLGEDDVAALASMVHVGDGTSHRRRSDDTARYLAASRLLFGAAQHDPVVVVVDDLHALDDASAALLSHLSAAAVHLADDRDQAMPLLTLIGTRPRGGSEATQRTLARLRDEQGAAELVLEGLDEVDLNAYLASLGPAPPDRSLLRAIRRQTGGNPLYARLVWNHLVAGGEVVRADGRMLLVDPTATDLGHLGLDDVVDERLRVLSPGCRRVLEVAAALGSEGDLGTLAVAVHDLDREEVVDLVGEARAAGVLHTRGDRYRFDHPLIVAALGRTDGREARRRLHLGLARTLAEQHPVPALEVAAHLRAAGPLAPAAERRRWGRASAEQAMSRGAWGDAVAGFGLCLDGDGGDAPTGSDRARLCAQATAAAAADHDLEACERFARMAVEAARPLDDLDTWCAAICELAHARIRVARGGSRADTAELEEFLTAVGTRAAGLRARVLAMLAEVDFARFDLVAGLDHAQQARQLASSTGDLEVKALVAFVQGLHHQGRFELDASERCFAESIALGGSTDRGPPEWARARLPSARWLRGRPQEAQEAADAPEERAGARLDWAELSLVAAWRANAAGTAGDFGEAEALATRALTLHARSDYAFTPILAHPTLAIARAVQGNVDGAHRSLDGWGERGPARWVERLHVLVDALGGRRDAVVAALDERPWPAREEATTDVRGAAALLARVEVGAAAGRADLVRTARPALEWLHGRGVRFVPGSLSMVARLCGVAAAADDDRTAAFRWLALARGEAQRAGAAAEGARCDLDEADLRRRWGDPAPTTDRLLADAALAFDRLRMLPFLRRAEDISGASGGSGVPRARKVILFTDLVESTQLNATSGDERYLQVLRTHDRVVRTALRDHDGVEFKHTGDGVAAWFTSPRQAIRCALHLHGALERAAVAQTGATLRIRCGLAAGEPIESEGDLFGLAVARAARVCALAHAGRVLLSEEVAAEPPGAGIWLTDLGPVDLRGLPRPVRVLEARSEPP